MQKSKQINSILRQPELLGEVELQKLQDWVKEYPYFQGLHCLFLKKLFIKERFQYNYELKKTAALTSNRSVLFDFITAKEFSQQAIAQQIQQLDKEEEYIQFEFGLTTTEANEISNPDLFVPKPITEVPLTFQSNEKHSFQEWLQIVHIAPVDRSLINEKNEVFDDSNAEATPKMDKIDSFLKNNPKISPIKNYTPKKEIKLKTSPSTQLMTETLARVYEEQKAYEKAIQAYKILILNNPEKSSFFALQIERLKQQLENNT